MTNPLVNRTVSDADAIAACKSLDMPPSQRVALWRERWEGSGALQREFKSGDSYVAYMEGLATGRVRVLSK